MRSPGQTALGAWSGGRFMHFGAEIAEDRLLSLLRPDGPGTDPGIRTVITADVYGQGEADTLVGRALEGVDRDDYCLVGAIGHDFYEGERQGPKGFPRFTDPGLRPAGSYDDYLWMAAERSLERLGVDRFDVLLLHNPDRTGYESEEVWSSMAGLREEGLAGAIGVAPGPANGFTLDIIRCFERFGSEIDWAMIILNPLEPWPGELCLDAAHQAGVRVIARVVDYGGVFWGDLRPDTELGPYDHRSFRPDGWIEAGREKLELMAPIGAEAGLTPIQLACQWDLAHPAVTCVVPTLIQEMGDDARPVEDKRAELAALPAEQLLTPEQVAEIRRIGENRGSMALKGGSAVHEGDDVADSWSLTEDLADTGRRWGIDPASDLVLSS